MAIKAIVGLGNPGSKYSQTRHNIGFEIVELLAQKHGVDWKSSHLMQSCQITLQNEDAIHTVYVIKPLTFMNDSGKITSFLSTKGIKLDELLVIHDELEKSFGSMSIKQGGSAHGHNGLRSIIHSLGDSFWRLRFGIGRPFLKDDVPIYVLARFTPQERADLAAHIEKAVEEIELMILKKS